MVFKPCVETVGIGIAFQPAGSHEFCAFQSRDDADAFLFAAWLACMATFTSFAPPIRIGGVHVQPRFIYPYTLLLWYRFQQFQELCSLCLVSLAVAIGLFFRVIPNFFSLRLRLIKLMDSSHAAAICARVLCA